MKEKKRKGSLVVQADREEILVRDSFARSSWTGSARGQSDASTHPGPVIPLGAHHAHELAGIANGELSWESSRFLHLSACRVSFT